MHAAQVLRNHRWRPAVLADGRTAGSESDAPGAASAPRQGSEYPAVVIPVVTQHYPMPQRNLLHTGVTRGKRLVVLVRQRKVIAIAVRGVSERRRWSKLREWFRAFDTDIRSN
jgi:hypothetical protein